MSKSRPTQRRVDALTTEARSRLQDPRVLGTSAAGAPRTGVATPTNVRPRHRHDIDWASIVIEVVMEVGDKETCISRRSVRWRMPEPVGDLLDRSAEKSSKHALAVADGYDRWEIAVKRWALPRWSDVKQRRIVVRSYAPGASCSAASISLGRSRNAVRAVARDERKM